MKMMMRLLEVPILLRVRVTLGMKIQRLRYLCKILTLKRKILQHLWLAEEECSLLHHRLHQLLHQLLQVLYRI